MKKIIIAIAAAFSASAMAHHPQQFNDSHDQYSLWQGQEQYQAQRNQQHSNQNATSNSASSAASATASSSNGRFINNHQNNSRTAYIQPVKVDVPWSIAPSANVSRAVGNECGPRMWVRQESVKGVNNRVMKAHEFEIGYDAHLEPMNEAYQRVDIMPGVYQLIGHRVIETSAVVTVSTGMGFGVGGGNSSGGGSLGVGASGAMQRLVTTIRLVDCVAYEVDTRKLKVKG